MHAALGTCWFRWGLLATLVAACAAPSAAQSPVPDDDLRDLVEEALDQTVQGIRIGPLPIREALQKLGEQTGLRFVLDESAVDWMPYGERTRVAIEIDGVSLRKGLRRMFDGLALAMRVEHDKVRVSPAPVLDRLGRRLTIEEVRLLHDLATHRWSELSAERRSVQFRAIGVPDPRRALEDAIAQGRAANAYRELEAATQNLGWYWVPQDESILVYSRSEDVWYRLERPVSLNYRGVPLDEVLVDLGERVGVTVLFESGVLDRIQAAERSIDLVHRQTTVLQTLERICGATGTCFEVQDYGVLIGMHDGPDQVPRCRPMPRIVALLRVPVGADGTTIEFPFYEDDLPPEFGNLLERKLPLVLEELRRREAEGD